jgi:hypothetical protein
MQALFSHERRGKVTKKARNSSEITPKDGYAVA